MLKLYTLIVFVLVFVSTLNAQENFKKYWKEGQLDWSDFKETNLVEGASLSYYIEFEEGKYKSNDTMFYRFETSCSMDQRYSWVHKDFKSDVNLRSKQIIFDIVEIHRRKFQKELDRVKKRKEAEILQFTVISNCKQEIEKYQKESDYGQNSKVVSLWETEISETLNENAEPSIPAFYKRNFGYGLHAGIGAGFYTGSLNNYFSPTINFDLGFDLAYKNIILFLNGTLASGKVKKDYLSTQNWYSGQRSDLTIIEASLGYACLDNSKIKLTPFVGYAVLELSGKNFDNEDDRLVMLDRNFIFGVNADYKFRKAIRLIPGLIGEKEYSEFSVRAKLFAARVNYGSDLNGFSINLSVGVNGFGNFIKFKK